MNKQWISRLLIFAILVSLMPVFAISAEAASLPDINDKSVFVSQGTGECTIAAEATMMRRKAILEKNEHWSEITLASVKKYGWDNNAGLKPTYTYKHTTNGVEDMSITIGKDGISQKTVKEKAEELKKQLDSHPEGVMLQLSWIGHNQTHAVTVTSYTGSSGNYTFYCVDPAATSNGITTLAKSTLGTNSKYTGIKNPKQDEILNNCTIIYVISKCKILATTSQSSTPTTPSTPSKPAYGIDMNPVMTGERVQGHYDITITWNHIASQYEPYEEAEYYSIQLGRSGTDFFDRSSYNMEVPASQQVNGVLTCTFEDVDYKDGTYSATIFAMGKDGKVNINYAFCNKIELKAIPFDMNPIMTGELVQGRYNITIKWNHITSLYEQSGEAEYYDVQLGRSGAEMFDRSAYNMRIPASQQVNGVLTCTFEDVDYKDGTYSATIFAYGDGGKTALNYAYCNKIELKTTHIHSLDYTSAKAASCTDEGNIAYYYCDECGSYFADENAANEITYQSALLEPLGHNYVSGVCSRCGAADPDYATPGHTAPENTYPNPVGAEEVSFSRSKTYYQGQFSDVPRNQWFTDSVADAYEFSLMKGDGDSFNPYGDVTLAETITMAARIHSIYTYGTEDFDQSVGNAWYQTYLDYAYENEIISGGFYRADVTKKATRAQFAEIFANSLPVNALIAISNVADNAIPDVSMSDPYASYVYRLYRAGILTGGDTTGTFSPETYITRAESAAIVSRMAESSNRVQFTLR